MTALDHNNALTPPFSYQRLSNLPFSVASAWFSEGSEVRSSEIFVEQDKVHSCVYLEQTEHDLEKWEHF